MGDIVEYKNRHAFSGLLEEDRETEIGIKWNKRKIFFILFGVSDERGEYIRKKVEKKVKTSKGIRINITFIFSCDLQEFGRCIKEAAIPLCSQS